MSGSDWEERVSGPCPNDTFCRDINNSFTKRGIEEQNKTGEQRTERYEKKERYDVMEEQLDRVNGMNESDEGLLQRNVRWYSITHPLFRAKVSIRRIDKDNSANPSQRQQWEFSSVIFNR